MRMNRMAVIPLLAVFVDLTEPAEEAVVDVAPA